MCAGRVEPRWCVGKAVYRARPFHPHWAHVVVVGAAERASHLDSGC